MRKTCFYFSFLLALLLPTIFWAQEREKILSPHVFKNAKNETLPYRFFVPQNYDRTKKYPLVVYLHGGGGVGDDNGESEPEREDAVDRPVSASEKSELSWLVAGDEGAGISSDSISSESGVGEGSASADGKKLRNRFSASTVSPRACRSALRRRNHK